MLKKLKFESKFAALLTETDGGSMLEYSLVLALAATGAVTLLSGAAEFFSNLLVGPIGRAVPYFLR